MSEEQNSPPPGTTSTTITTTYTREWVGLTDEEVKQICGSVPAMKEAVREAEAKLKEKNT